MPSDPIVVAARRTPIGTCRHSLAGHDVPALTAPVLRALWAELDAAGARPEPSGRVIDDVILGNCCGPGGDVARVSALAAGLGVDVPGLTVDRQCGSGLEAIRLAALAVGSGAADLVLAGGAESASLAGPHARAAFTPPGTPDPEMGAAAQELADDRGVSRQRQDDYAARSHALALEARAAGVYDAELVPLGSVRQDERPRRLTMATLGRLPGAFVAGGSVTAGNSCGVNDGAAVVAVVPERTRARLGLPGLRVLASCVVGVDPRTPGLGPVPAVLGALRAAHRTLDDVAVLEITEAFAAQVLACTDALGLDPLGRDGERVCPQGGALALGHPWGASGALLVVRLFSRLVRRIDARPGDLGVATCAIGGGQGIAVVVERVG